MSFGRKIATRILLAYLFPLAFMLAFGILYVHLTGKQISLRGYALGMMIVLVPALFIGWLFTRPITRHLAQLRRSAERIERGDYDARLSGGKDKDEFADVARAFNHMADVIAAREHSLREQNQVLASLNHRMESVLNATNDGIALLDRNGRFALVNRRFCEMLGTRAENLLHQVPEDASPELIDYLARIAAVTPGSLHEPRAVAENIFELPGPERRALQVYTAPVQGEERAELIGRIIALRDVTRERELDKMKTDFVSVVSHELRTPLTSIKGYTDLLLSGAAGDINELQREFLGITQTSTTRLTSLINDMLDISRIESGRIEIKHEPIDYRQIVDDTLRLMKAPADERNITMEASLPESMPPVRGDTDKVAQVLTNLVSNALKYTPPGGWIKVILEVSGDASVTTCVADSGIGISPADQKKLFQRFFRADNTSTREAGGTGLGLVIAKSIVEILGGAIWVESETGQGSRFYFTLPLYLETVQAPAPKPVALPDRGIGLVLVVDDDDYVRNLVQHHLHRRGYGTLEAANGEDALQKARQHKPDVITLDMLMPGMDGLHVLRALKQDRATATIPVVTLSAVGDPARGALSLGAFSFLQKPFDEDRFIRTMAEAIRSVRDRDAKTGMTVLFVGLSQEAAQAAQSRQEIETAVSKLAAQGITLKLVDTAPEAIALTVLNAPDMILIDMAMPEADLFELLSALKAEEEAARIPIILLSEDISDEGIHFHLGNDTRDNNVSLDYLCEQLSRVLSQPEGSAK